MTAKTTEWQHPRYTQMAPYWDFMRAAYLGGRTWYDQGRTGTTEGFRWYGGDNAATTHQEFSLDEDAHLWRHPREPEAFYRLRLRDAVYWNYPRPIVDGMAGAVVKRAKPPTLPSQLSYLATDTDGKGTDYDDWRRTWIGWALVYGVVDLAAYLPDKRPTDAETGERKEYASLDEQVVLGGVPRLRIVSPLDRIDWVWDNENCVYLKYVERVRLPQVNKKGLGEPPGEEYDDKVRFQYRVWTPEGSTLYDDAGEEIGSEPGYGFVPFVPAVFNRDPGEVEPIGLPLIEDVAELARLTYNKFSWLTDEQKNNCFNQKFVKGLGPKQSQDEAMAFGSGLVVSAEDFKIVAPDVEPMRHLEESIQEDQRRADAIVGNAEATEAEGVKSGIAIQLSKEKEEARLANVSKEAEGSENAALNMAKALLQPSRRAGVGIPRVLEGKEGAKYGRDFSSLTAAARVDQVISAIEKGKFTGKALVELQLELLRGTLPDLEADVLEKFRGELLAAEETAKAQREAEAEAFAAGGLPPEEGENPAGGGEFPPKKPKPMEPAAKEAA